MVKMSARLLLEYLAGRIAAERFHDNSTGRNLFEHWLKSGFVIRDARFESAGLDEDDDHVILELRATPRQRSSHEGTLLEVTAP